MSSNHYGHIPPPPANLYPPAGNRPNPDFNSLPQWSFNQSDEYENREKYMETELTEERYNNCDNSVNQNEIPDDEPCPPPGLRRLVTGQTVSFDEGPNSPPFDRVVPGEGSAFNSYPAPSQLPPVNDPTFSNRIVSGSSAFNNSYPVQSQLPPPVNDVTVSERFVSGGASAEYNKVPPHMFASVPQTKQEQHDSSQFFNSFSTSEAHGDDFPDSYLRTKNTPDERASHQLQVKNKPLPPFKPASNAQSQPQPQQPYFNFSKISPNPNTNSAFKNYQHRSQSGKAENTVQYNNAFSQRTFDDYAKIKNEMNDSMAVDTANAEPAHRDKEKRIQNDSLGDKKSTSRMVVEGATNTSQPKMVSTSTPVHSPSYDHWYENQVPNKHEFPPAAVDARTVHHNRITDDKFQVTQPTTVTPFAPVTTSNANTHSKTTSMSSNTSSVNELSSYQQNESYTNVDGAQKRKEVYDSMDGGAPKFNHHTNIRPDELAVKTKSAETQMYESRLNDKSNIVYGESDEYAVNVQNKTRKDNERTKYSNVSNMESQEAANTSFNREPVPGAQSTPDNSQRSFSKSSVNVPTTYGYQNENTVENDDDERDEVERYSDSDDKRSMGQRIVPGYNNYNTIPAARKSHSKLYSDSRGEKRTHTNVKPSFETRMVVGKMSGDVSFKNSSGRVYDDQYEREDHDLDRERNRLYDEERDRRFKKESSRYEKDRRKPIRGRSRNESDEEEYPESVGHGHDISPDRGSRSYRERRRRDSPTRYKRSSQRTDCESSVTQDDSFYEDEDDDRDVYRRYDSRRQPRSRSYRPYYTDSMERDWSDYCDQPYWYRHPDDVYAKSSRPSSRSGSRDQPEFSNSARKFKHRMEKSNSRTPSKEEIQYWTERRHIDPEGYILWYKEAYPEKYRDWYNSRRPKQKTHQDDRRGSGHSGQSSINNDSISMHEKLMGMKNMSISRDSVISAAYEQRKSPFKFEMAHVRGFFNSLGQLIVVNESCPKEGQPANIDVYKISPPEDDPEDDPDVDPDVVEFLNFTGPFIVGETHVNTVSAFVRSRADSASTISEKLLYLLIDLIIKLRGVTDGIAISELLMSTYRESPPKNEPSPTYPKSGSATNALGEHEILEKYTNLLLQGNKNAALDWAIHHKLWGHAFLLAEKMGDKHHSNVLAKFDASIPTNNPLKTLYQLYSNQIPQAATACADEKWGDWRPHLAMILSNPTPNNEVDKKAIITLGDSLHSKDIFASHFCYLAAEATFDVWSKPSARLSLLTLRNGVDHFGVNTSYHAILLTQAYEFAKRLQRKEFIISALLPYKYLLAVRLIDFGKCDLALQYLESVAAGLQNDADDANEDLADNVLELADSIKYSDSKPFVADRSVDPPWLTNLREKLAATTNAQPKPSNEQYTSNDVPLMDPQTFQSYKQPQLPQPLPVQQKQQQQQQEQCQEQTPIGIQQPLMFPAPLQQQQSPMIMTQNQTQPTLLPLPPQDQKQSWDINSSVANHHNSFNDYGQPQHTQPLPLSTGPSYGVENANSGQFQKDDDQPNDFYSPWDQPTQVSQISMHSTSNSFYDDGPPKPVAKTKTRSVAVAVAVTTTATTTTKSVAATTSVSTTVSRINRATLRKQVQANVASKQHYSIWKHYLSRRRTDERADRNNRLGQLVKNASLYDARRNSEIVFNGTFPIDRPFGVRHSLGPKTSRIEEPVRAPQGPPAAKETEREAKDGKHEKKNGSWWTSIGMIMKPKNNQMKLPDDKNPPIVWDEIKKKWVDKTAESDDSPNVIQPPPRAADLRPLGAHPPEFMVTQPPYMGNTMPRTMQSKPMLGIQGNDAMLPSAAPPAGSNNIYKLKKGKGMKGNYVNVLSPTSNMPSTSNSIMDSSSVPAGSPNVNFMPPSG